MLQCGIHDLEGEVIKNTVQGLRRDVPDWRVMERPPETSRKTNGDRQDTEGRISVSEENSEERNVRRRYRNEGSRSLLGK